MPSTTAHSRSLSLSSTRSSNDGTKKKFCCTFPACGKSFSRSEHLHRHALNHKDGNNTCLRCSAHFRRRDLLDRHMARHKEKDDEAGGEGLGILATRKRLWRDADGNIVNGRRPSYTQEGGKRRQVGRTERSQGRSASVKTGKAAAGSAAAAAAANDHLFIQTNLPSPIDMPRPDSSTIVVDGRPDIYGSRREMEKVLPESNGLWMDMNSHALPSPPNTNGSHRSGARSPSVPLGGELDALYEETWSPLTHDGIPQLSSAGSGSQTPSLTSSSHPSPYFGTANWGNTLTAHHSAAQPFQTFMGAGAAMSGDGPYDDLFHQAADVAAVHSNGGVSSTSTTTGNAYGWQGYGGPNGLLMSRCRVEKYDPFVERKVDWAPMYPAPEQPFARSFGMGTV